MVLHVWQKHSQRVRMVCPVRCPGRLEWALLGRHRKSVDPGATMSGNDVRNSGRSARPRPPPRELALRRAPVKIKTKWILPVHGSTGLISRRVICMYAYICLHIYIAVYRLYIAVYRLCIAVYRLYIACIHAYIHRYIYVQRIRIYTYTLYAYTYMQTCIYVFMHMYTCAAYTLYVYIRIAYTYIYIPIRYTYIYVCMYMHMHVCMYMYMYMHQCVYVYTFIHIHQWAKWAKCVRMR